MGAGLRYQHRVGAAIGIAALTLMTGVARAQEPEPVLGVARPERPNRAIFGGGYGATDHALIATGHAGTGVSTAGFGRNEGDFGQGQSAVSTNLDGTLSYRLGRPRVGIGAAATSSARYFPNADGLWTTANSGTANVRWQPALRTRLDAEYGVSRDPLSALDLLPGLDDEAALPLLPLDYGIGERRAIYQRQEFAVGVTQSLSRRVSASAGYHANRTTVTDEGVDRWLGGWIAALTYDIGRGLAARVGYGRDEAVFEATETTPEYRLQTHRIDAGISFNRALSLSRRTALAFNTGSLVFVDEGRRRYEVVGAARLQRELGRTWYASVGYVRDIEFVDVLTRPALTDSITSTVAGQAGRRLRIVGDGGWSRGEIGLGVTGNNYRVFRGGVGVTAGLTQTLGLSARYSYFWYDFANRQGVPGDVPATTLSRQTVRVGLDVYVPLFTRMRRP